MRVNKKKHKIHYNPRIATAILSSSNMLTIINLNEKIVLQAYIKICLIISSLQLSKQNLMTYPTIDPNTLNINIKIYAKYI